MNVHATSLTVLEGIARMVHSVRYEELPPEVVRTAKSLVLDSLGCAYGAVNSEVGHAVRRMASECGGASQATILGSGEKTSAPLATLVNGSLIRYLDSNDYYFARDPAHPSGNLAAGLAIAEREQRTGKELLAALVAAYEVHLRLCEFAGEPSLWKRGWHHGTNSAFSSAALASRLSGHTPLVTAHAMAIAGSHQNTLAQLQSGAVSMIKATAEAWVAKAGVEAALLAGHGITGPLQLMEGEAGWARSVAGKVDFDSLCAPIADRYRLMETSVKPYPAVATALAPIRASIELHRRGAASPEGIKKMIVKLPGYALRTPSADIGRRYPESIESAQHSFYYCTAVALLDGECGDAQFSNSKWKDTVVRDLLAKIELAEDAELNERWPQAAGGGIELHMQNGTVQRHDCPYPPGHPKLPMDQEEVTRKFFGYVAPVLGQARADALHQAVENLENCSDMREVAALLAP